MKDSSTLTPLQRGHRKLVEAAGGFFGALTSGLPPDQRQSVLAGLSSGELHYHLALAWPSYRLQVVLSNLQGEQILAIDLTATPLTPRSATPQLN